MNDKQMSLERSGSYMREILESDSDGNPMIGSPLGIARGIVRLCDYDYEWPKLFEQEAELISQALRDRLIDIQHFGSTSVPGLRAKPLVDILVGVDSMEPEAEIVSRLKAIGYEYRGSHIVKDNLIFALGKIRTHLIHVTEYDNYSWRDCVRFRDALRTRPDLALQYQEHKQELLNEYSQDRAGYTSAKARFVVKVLRQSALKQDPPDNRGSGKV